MTCAVPVDPVFIDLETRSTCDLRKEGGFRYADNANTRLLTVAWTADMGRSYHVWLPSADGEGATVPVHLPLHLPGVTVHWGNGYVPKALADAAHRPWVGHNAWTFDRQVWALCGDPQPPFWIDTYPLALACGLPGSLDKIGLTLDKEGKYEQGNKVTKEASRVTEGQDPDPINVPVVTQIMVARYNVQDVRIMVRAWPVLTREVRLTPHEQKVLRCHDACNSRGVRIDRPFVRDLISLTHQAQGHATRQIAELTAGHKNALQSDADLRSRTKVFAWLDEMGVKIGSSLRRDVVARFIDEHSGDGYESLETGEAGDTAEDREADSGAWENIPLVVKVLELRMQALRVTGGKLDAALQRTSDDGRLRGWSAYWAAHTGRWAGRGLQPHNFPRPKEGVDVWDIVGVYEEHRRQQDWSDKNPKAHGPVRPFDYVTIRDRMPIGAKGADEVPLYPYLSVDDAASGLLRSMVLPDEGKVLAAADLANIEARVLAWLAGEEWLMKAFWDGADPYMLMAAKIFGPRDGWPVFPDPKTGKPLPARKHPYRQVGKVVVLGCGYQLGVDSFTTYAAAQGIDLKAVGTTPGDCIVGYRRMHPAIAGKEKEWKGKPYFRDGYWDILDNAAVAAVKTGGPVSVRGMVTFEMKDGHLIVTLPSGRELKYRHAKVVQTTFHKREIDQVTFISARYNGMRLPIYGGKWCWAGGTRVLTNRGVVPIEMVTRTDLVWDGEEWVPTGGAMYIGTKEVGTWLGERVTGDHLITDGKTWSSVMHSDVKFTERCLSWGRDSVCSVWKVPDPVGKTPWFDASVPGAETSGTHQSGDSYGTKLTGARPVPTGRRPKNDPTLNIWPRCFPTRSFGRCGVTGTPDLSPGVRTPSIEPTPTTGGGVSQFTGRGWRTGSCSSSTSRPYPTGIGSGSTWTGSTMTDTTNRETFVWSLDESTRITGVPVYDLLNCGPRHRYTVMTVYGPVVVHNCENIVQAASRDVLAHGFVALEETGYSPVNLHVHDELAASIDPDEGQMHGFMKAVTTPPPWLTNFPLDAEGSWAPRYAKSPNREWKDRFGDEWLYRNGERKK